MSDQNPEEKNEEAFDEALAVTAGYRVRSEIEKSPTAFGHPEDTVAGAYQTLLNNSRSLQSSSRIVWTRRPGNGQLTLDEAVKALALPNIDSAIFRFDIILLIIITFDTIFSLFLIHIHKESMKY